MGSNNTGTGISQLESRLSITEDNNIYNVPSCLYCFKEIWRRIKMEIVVEWPMLKSRWKTILFGAIFQYVHGIFTQLEKRLHEPQVVPLGDLGFSLMKELGKDKVWVSETIFYFMFISFILWVFSPFVIARKRFYSVVLLSRLLVVLVVCQTLRIISFLSTQLPAPNYHCRKGEPTATLDWPDHWYEHFVFDPVEQAAFGCGDLIFSSHTTFILVGVLSYTTYGKILLIKIIAWILSAILSLLIIASRKHYTVDIVVAWYTVPLVFYTLERRWKTKRHMGEDVDEDISEDDEVPDEENCLNSNGRESKKMLLEMSQIDNRHGRNGKELQTNNGNQQKTWCASLINNIQ